VQTSNQPSACDVLAEPIVVCRAHGTCVVLKNLKENKGEYIMKMYILMV
jgi:3-aminobutyryl-CoA ammonia-lyase